MALQLHLYNYAAFDRFIGVIFSNQVNFLIITITIAFYYKSLKIDERSSPFTGFRKLLRID